MQKKYLVKIKDSLEELLASGVNYIEPLGKGLDSKNFLVVSNSHKYILKEYRENIISEIGYELDILRSLNKSKKGVFPEIASNIFYVENKPHILLNYISGEKLQPKQINKVNILKIAQIHAGMHLALKNFKSDGKRKRFSIFDFSFIRTFEYHCSRSLFNKINKESVKSEQELSSFKTKKFPRSIIHEDLTADNILIDKKGNIRFIDFGEAHEAEMVSDIAIAIKELILAHKGLALDLIEKYIFSYNKVNSIFDQNHMKIIYPLMRRRALFMLVYYLSKKTAINDSLAFRDNIESELYILELLGKHESDIRSFLSLLII